VAAEPEYRERALPYWWAWLLPLGVVLMLAVAYGAALGPAAGYVIAAAGTALVAVVMWTSSPVMIVSRDGLTVGRATLPLDCIGEVEPLTKADIVRLRGPGADARLFTAVRTWSAREGLLVHVNDPDDPHPAWLISTRNPVRAIDALAATMGGAATTDNTERTPMEDA
jgi:hypothetical protein